MNLAYPMLFVLDLPYSKSSINLNSRPSNTGGYKDNLSGMCARKLPVSTRIIYMPDLYAAERLFEGRGHLEYLHTRMFGEPEMINLCAGKEVILRYEANSPY